MKKNLKKIATLLGICATFCIGTHAFAESFLDMPQDSRKEALEAAVSNGLLNGYDVEGGREIRPDGKITRAEMGTILVRAMGAEKVEDISNFVDMNKSQWHYDYMSKAVAMGAFKGDDKNQLNPQNNITFQEAFIVLTRIFDLADRKSDNTDDPFAGWNDANLVADWAKNEVGILLKHGYWSTADRYLRPTEYITRGEFAQVMHNLVKTYIDEDDVKTEDGTITVRNEDGSETTKEVTIKYVDTFVEGNVVIRADDVTIRNYNQPENDIYVADGIDTTTTLENCFAYRLCARNGSVTVYDGYVTEVRMLTPENTLITNKLPIDNIKYIDAAKCTLSLPTIEM